MSELEVVTAGRHTYLEQHHRSERTYIALSLHDLQLIDTIRTTTTATDESQWCHSHLYVQRALFDPYYRQNKREKNATLFKQELIGNYSQFESGAAPGQSKP